MKQTVLPVILILVSLLAGCARGDVSNVQKIVGRSAVYTAQEIESAMDLAIDHFRREFEGCTMTEISYEETVSERSASAWVQTYAAEECIVLLSSFDVDSGGCDGSLNPNSTYTKWQWVLVRSDNAAWELKTWGYG